MRQFDNPDGSWCLEMRVGVYIDGYNVYYGGRTLCGRSTAGWRWLDLGALAESIVRKRNNWPGAVVERAVYCTARVDATESPSSHADQDVYLKALDATGSVDHIEYGHYVARVKSAPLAVRQPKWPPAPGHSRLAGHGPGRERGGDQRCALHCIYRSP